MFGETYEKFYMGERDMPKDLPITDLNIQITQGAPVELPSANLLVDAAFTRDGGDLVLELDNGQTITVEGYFGMDAAPALVTPDGARMTPEMVNSFLKSAHAGEYASNATTLSDAGGIGQISEVVGTVLITRADGTEVIAEKGTLIMQGDVVETSADGAANIVFADNTNFAISEDARMSVDEFTYDTASQEGSSFFSMLKGAFVYTSGMIGKDDPGNVNIETPAGSIGIRGTVVMGKIDPTGQDSEITILDGAVVITNAAGTVELDDSLETVKLSDYNSEPVMVGQISANDVQQNYQSLKSVSGTTFDQAFDPQQQNEGQDATTQQQGENAGEADMSTDGEQQQSEQPAESSEQTGEEAAAETTQETATTEQVQTQETTLDVPQNLNDSTVQTQSGTKTTSDTSTDGSDADASGTQSSSSAGTNTTTNQTQDTTDTTDTTAPRPNDDGSALTFNGVQNTVNGTEPLVREFEDVGFEVGQVNLSGGSGTYAFTITGYDEAITAGEEPFQIDGEGNLYVDNPYALDAQDFLDIGVQVQAADTVTGETINFTVNVTIDELLPQGASRIIGTEGDDTSLTTVATADELVFAGAGNDVISDTSDGHDVLLGGTGDDLFQITGGDGFTEAFGGQGADTFEDTSAITTAENVYNGEMGDDNFVLTSNAAKQKVMGGDGQDTLTLHDGNADTRDIYDGGNGWDFLKLDQASIGGTMDLSGTNSTHISGFEEIEILRDGSANVFTLQLDSGTVMNMTDGEGILTVNHSATGALPSTLDFTDSGWAELAYGGADSDKVDFFNNNSVYYNSTTEAFVISENITTAQDTGGTVVPDSMSVNDTQLDTIMPELANIL